MKRFIVSVLSVSVFFLGLGTLIEKVGARFKSDEKALELIRAAKTAIGGDNAIAGIQSLRIKGTTTHAFKVDGTERTENGETEIAMQLPDKLSKMVKIGRADGEMPGDQIVNKRVETVIVRTDKDGNEIVGKGSGSGTGVGIGTEPGKRVVIVKDGDTPGEFKTQDGQIVVTRRVGEADLPAKTENNELRTFRINRAEIEAHHREAQTNELFRLTLGLLLSPPVAMAVNYTFGGEVKAADRPCNLVIADVGGSQVKLYLDRDSNVPVMMAYTGEAMPMIVHFNKEVPAPNGGDDASVVFFRKSEGPSANAEYTVRFDDYRETGGVQLPYKWVTTAGDMNEVFNVTSYEVNPSDISNSFKEQKIGFSVKKDGQ
jgi:hypothetical protein